MLYSVIARLMLYTVIARRALPDVAILFTLYSVMLSNAKHLEACTTIHRLRDLEILHFVQNDIVGVQNDSV